MGYYVRSDYSGYYEGDKEYDSDISVTERPFVTCSWDGAAWVYDLVATRKRVKNIYSRAMEEDILSALSASSNPNNTHSIIGGAYLFADLAAYADNIANNCPFIDGYRAITGETKADAVTSLTGFGDVAAQVYGKCIAQLRLDYADIDAAVTGADIIAITYVRPF
jgi:hypothetical protein